MKILELEQGSQEWLDVRKGILTASNFFNVITSKGERSKRLNDYAFDLAASSLLTTAEATFTSPAMERGNELEPYARQKYCEDSFTTVEEVGIMLSDCGNYGYSPDGLVDDDGLIEIKCPMAKNHAKYLSQKRCPTEYYAQVQGGLYVSGRQWCDFVSYHPDFEEDHILFVHRVERNEEFISNLKSFIDETILLRDNIIQKIKSS
jgi:putative phage-type endonuclease